MCLPYFWSKIFWSNLLEATLWHLWMECKNSLSQLKKLYQEIIGRDCHNASLWSTNSSFFCIVLLSSPSLAPYQTLMYLSLWVWELNKGAIWLCMHLLNTLFFYLVLKTHVHKVFWRIIL